MKKFYSLLLLAAAAFTLPFTAAAATDDVVVFRESFDGLAGHGGNDGYFDNDDDAGIEIAAEDLTDASLLDNTDGWGEFVKVAVCNKCVRLATKKNPGELTTPAITLDGAKAVLTFNAAAQLGDAATLNVEILDGGTLTYDGTTAAQVAVALPETVAGTTTLADRTYTLEINDAAATCRLRFSAASSKDNKQRVFLDEIRVVKSVVNGIGAAPAAPSAADAVFTIDGRRLSAGTLGSLRPGLYILGGRKILVK